MVRMGFGKKQRPQEIAPQRPLGRQHAADGLNTLIPWSRYCFKYLFPIGLANLVKLVRDRIYELRPSLRRRPVSYPLFLSRQPGGSGFARRDQGEQGSSGGDRKGDSEDETISIQPVKTYIHTGERRIARWLKRETLKPRRCNSPTIDFVPVMRNRRMPTNRRSSTRRSRP